MKNKNTKSVLSAFLITALLIPSVATAATFGDVSETHKHYVAVEYLKDAGVIGGYDDGSGHDADGGTYYNCGTANIDENRTTLIFPPSEDDEEDGCLYIELTR